MVVHQYLTSKILSYNSFVAAFSDFLMFFSRRNPSIPHSPEPYHDSLTLTSSSSASSLFSRFIWTTAVGGILPFSTALAAVVMTNCPKTGASLADFGRPIRSQTRTDLIGSDHSGSLSPFRAPNVPIFTSSSSY